MEVRCNDEGPARKQGKRRRCLVQSRNADTVSEFVGKSNEAISVNCDSLLLLFGADFGITKTLSFRYKELFSLDKVPIYGYLPIGRGRELHFNWS